MNKLDKACQMHQEVGQMQLKILRSDHPEYLTTKNNLAFCYSEMNELDKACQMLQEVEQIQLKLLGSDHPEYLITKNNLKFVAKRKKDTKSDKNAKSDNSEYGM